MAFRLTIFFLIYCSIFRIQAPGTKLYMYNTGLHALEEYHHDIAENIRYFLD